MSSTNNDYETYRTQSEYFARYTMKDPEFIQLTENNTEQSSIVVELLVVEFLPIARLLPKYRKAFNRGNELNDEFRELLKSKYAQRRQTYQDGIVRDFSDALILAKNEAEAEGLDSTDQLNDDNLALVLLDLFLAGTDTTKFTMQWAVLLMAYHPETQAKMRQEIEEVVGDQIVTLEHKSQLNYVQSFIAEVMRFRPVVPLGLPHKAIVNSLVAGHEILKGTTVHLHQYAILQDSEHWENPNEFKPDRFLDKDGKHYSRQAAFVPFGTGRRMCLGEKLALTDLLFITCRLLQATSGYVIALEDPDKADLQGDLGNATGLSAIDHKFVLKPDK